MTATTTGEAVDRAAASRRGHDFLLATLIGLSWFVLAQVSFRAARALALAGYGRGAQWWPILSSTRLVLGLVFYVPLAFVVTTGPWWGRSGRLYSLGLVPTSGTTVARTLALAVTAILFSGPAVVWSEVRQHFDGSLLSFMSGLQPPLIEELLVRGVVWAVLARSFSSGVVLLWSSILFWSWHWEFGLMASGTTAAWATAVCGLPRIATGLIWPGVLFHLMGNAGVGQFLPPPVAFVAITFIGWDVVRTRSGRTRG